jgi:LPS-assembly protein
MKSKFLIIFYLIFFCTNAIAENILIEAKNISLDKDRVTSIFENEVKVKTKNGVIKSEYVKYNKKTGTLIIKNNVVMLDNENNTINTEYAEYNENNKIFTSRGPTTIITSEKYILEGKNITLNNEKRIIFSKEDSILKDQDGNRISLINFEYLIEKNIFKSLGLVNIKDKIGNSYNFSQIYIDTKKKEILGTDIKAFLNNQSFKINEKNDPRIFSNTAILTKNKITFDKSIFTLCEYRKKDKCPPWTIQSSKMLHDSQKKTIYYDNAVIKIYDIPIFYFPKLSHPDPTVDRRSGFLQPKIYSTKNLGKGFSIPYFFDLGKDKNLTLTNRLYVSENPLFLGEYHQVFKNSSLLTDFGFTEGYKKTSVTKKSGDKSHFFSKFTKNFTGKDDSDNSFNISVQTVSNDKYLQLYRIKTDLVDYEEQTLESSIEFSHQKDDFFLGVNAKIFETLQQNYTDKYEYILPEISIDKNLFNNQNFGNLDLESNLRVRNYDTNKVENFLVNNFNWKSKDFYLKNGIKNKFLGNVKNINFETKNVGLFKEQPTSELFATLGLLSELDLQKVNGESRHLLTPKMLIRYSPGQMREELTGSRIDPDSAFTLNRLNGEKNNEAGLNATLGLDYKINENFDFSVAQIINEKENKKMNDKTSLNEKLSDLVGSVSFDINEKLKLNYNFSLDQNYQDINYSEIGAKVNLGNFDVNFDYLEENKHIGDQEYFSTKIDYNNTDQSQIVFETKRNLITNSAEFYNLSYEYINDCLRAGVVYRREFYTDSEIEPENSLLFQITLVPFGTLNTPTFSR